MHHFLRTGNILLLGSLFVSVMIGVALFSAQPRVFPSQHCLFSHHCVSPDGQFQAFLRRYDNKLELWNSCTQKQLATLEGPDSDVTAIAFTPKMDILATADYLGRIWLWQMATKTRQAIPQGHTGRVTALAFSADGKVLASGGEDEIVRLWDSATGMPQGAFRGFTNPVTSLAFHPNGRILASAQQRDPIFLWDLSHFKELRLGSMTWNPTGQEVVFSPDGNVLAIGDRYAFITLLDVPAGTRRVINSISREDLCGLSFSPNGRVLAVALEHSVELWDVGSLKNRAVYGPGGNKPLSFAFHHVFERPQPRTPEEHLDTIFFTPQGQLFTASFSSTGFRHWEVGAGGMITCEDALWGIGIASLVLVGVCLFLHYRHLHPRQSAPPP